MAIVLKTTRKVINGFPWLELLVYSPTTENTSYQMEADMGKRIFLKNLQAHDQRTGDCAVRELEMAVDTACTVQGYQMQFFRDAALYGVDEAITYLATGGYGDATSVSIVWERIKERLN